MTYQFKIQIKGVSKPPIWRRILIPAGFTFDNFHQTIQIIFGWDFEHPYFFSPKGFNSEPVIEKQIVVDEDELLDQEALQQKEEKEEDQSWKNMWVEKPLKRDSIDLEDPIEEPAEEQAEEDGSDVVAEPVVLQGYVTDKTPGIWDEVWWNDDFWNDDWDDDYSMDAVDVVLAEVFEEEGQTFTYIYGDLDDWTLHIVLEKIFPFTKSVKPIILKAKGSCLPVFCDSPSEYAHYKKVVADPTDFLNEITREIFDLEPNETWDVETYDMEAYQEQLNNHF